MAFLDNDYLFSNNSAKTLFGTIGGLPIVDPHNHANVSEISVNKNYQNPWQFFIGTDHYI